MSTRTREWPGAGSASRTGVLACVGGAAPADERAEGLRRQLA
ncbi:hypothetical protein ACFU7T_04155 [Streptomyces sp. NPDC057555]